MGRMKAKHRIADRLFFLLLTILVFSSCTNSKKDIIPSAEYAPFVNAYTGGVISQTSNIRIELTQDQPRQVCRSGQSSERIQILFQSTGTQFHTVYRTTDNHRHR